MGHDGVNRLEFLFRLILIFLGLLGPVERRDAEYDSDYPRKVVGFVTMSGATASAAWKVWSCDASVVVTNPADIAAAKELVQSVLREVEDACSRFRPDSELRRHAAAFTRGAEASPMLACLVRAALEAAQLTDGDVDPTLGNELAQLGYDRDLSALPATSATTWERIPVSTHVRRRSWKDVQLVDNVLTIPIHVQLDLGATAKAVAADLSAAAVVERFGGGALVALGGDIATSGTGPSDGWGVLVQDTETDPSQHVLLAAGAAMATSSTQKRRWSSGGYLRHHILDPGSGLPATPTWRSVTVAASTCLEANAMSTASIVRGFRAVQWLNALNVGARFVDVDGRVVSTDQWPVGTEPRELEEAIR